MDNARDLYVDGDLLLEQNKLAAERCPVLLRPRAKSLTLIKATSEGPQTLGDTVRVFDSPSTREIALRAGWLPCDGHTFDETRWPELRRHLGSNRTPQTRQNT